MLRPGPRDDESRRAMRDIGLYTSIHIMLGVGPLLGWWLGKEAQQRWGGEPWLVVAGVVLGLAVAVRQVYKVIKRGSEQE